MNKKEALTQLEIMATNATGRLGEAKSEEEKALLSKEIEVLHTGFRTPQTKEELYEVLETMPEFLKAISEVE